MGDDPDRVSAVALCRGGVEPDICRSCVEDARGKTVQSCPNQKEAFGGYDECMIHYSNVSTLGSWSRFPEIYLGNPYNSSSPEQFNKGLQNLLDDLRGRAANDTMSGPDFRTTLAAVQCPPDEEVPVPDGNNKTVIIIVVCIVAGLIGIAICIFIIYRKFQKMKAANSYMERLLYEEENIEESSSSVEISPGESLSKFELSTLQNATNNFSEENKIGEGGFGVVYKGELQNGELIAVKRLSKSSRQGNLEFKNEVELIAKLQHKNLVKLFGYCQEEGEMILEYEFVPNGGLDDFLFDKEKRGYLNWERRYTIIENIARGLVYLHQDSRHRIIHRDLKANNILLDADLNPKITDFGMARLFALNQAQGSTNTLVGAYGYVAPEYARYGNFSDKSDVYSFGVLVLEIISGQRHTT